MKTYRSSTLRYAFDYCPKALDHYELGVPQDRSVFEVGLGAHAVLQAIGKATNAKGVDLSEAEVEEVARSAAKKIASEGYVFAGEQQPPISADAAIQGRDLARDWYWTEANSRMDPLLVSAPGQQVFYEAGLGATARWEPCEASSPEARWVAAIDVLALRDVPGEVDAREALVRDYKSSWATSEADLDTIQRKGQALLAFIHFGDEVDLIKREVVNLRTRQVFTAETWVEDSLEIVEWQDDLEAMIEALDVEPGTRRAIPGIRCHGCPYIHACEAAQAYLDLSGRDASIEEKAKQYAVLEATRKDLRKELKVASDERGPIDTGDELVGIMPREIRKPREGSHRIAWELWEQQGGGPVDFAHAVVTGVRNLEEVAKRTGMPKDERDEWIDQNVETKVQRRFQVKRKESA